MRVKKDAIVLVMAGFSIQSYSKIVIPAREPESRIIQRN